MAPVLFKIYINDQTQTIGSRNSIYADNLALAVQAKDFEMVEKRLAGALRDFTEYYQENQPIDLKLKCAHLIFEIKKQRVL